MRKVKLIRKQSIPNLPYVWTPHRKISNVIKFHTTESYLDDKDVTSILLGIIKIIREDERKRVIDILKQKGVNNK